jgi:hypothetical protein
MSEDKEPFLARWSRLKRRRAAEAALAEVTPPAAPADAPAPQLPPVEDLTLESDFKDFMHDKVEETVRRAALRKLFHDPHFNVRDGLDVYADDYTKLEKLPPEMVGRLRAARRALGLDVPEATEADGEPLAQPPAAAQPAPPQDAQAAREPAPGDADDRERAG